MSSESEDSEPKSKGSDNEVVIDNLEHMKLVEVEQEDKSLDAISPAPTSSNNDGIMVECPESKESPNNLEELVEPDNVLHTELSKETGNVFKVEQEEKSLDATTQSPTSSNKSIMVECPESKESPNNLKESEVVKTDNVLQAELSKQTGNAFKIEETKETGHVLTTESTEETGSPIEESLLRTENVLSVEMPASDSDNVDSKVRAPCGEYQPTEGTHVGSTGNEENRVDIASLKNVNSDKASNSEVKEGTVDEFCKEVNTKPTEENLSGLKTKITGCDFEEEMLKQDQQKNNQKKDQSTVKNLDESDFQNRSEHDVSKAVVEKNSKDLLCSDSVENMEVEGGSVAAEGHDVAPDAIEKHQNVKDVVRDFLGQEDARIVASDSSQSTQEEMSDYSSYATEALPSDQENRDPRRSSAERQSAERRLSPVQEDQNAESDSVYEQSMESHSEDQQAHVETSGTDDSAAFHQRNQWLEAAAAEIPPANRQEAAEVSNPEQDSDASKEVDENSDEPETSPEINYTPARRRTRTMSIWRSRDDRPADPEEVQKFLDNFDYVREDLKPRESWQKSGTLPLMKSTVSSQDSYFGDDEKSVSESIKLPTVAQSENKQEILDVDVTEENATTAATASVADIKPQTVDALDENNKSIDRKSPEKMDVDTSDPPESTEMEQVSSPEHEILKAGGDLVAPVEESVETNLNVDESVTSKSASRKVGSKDTGNSESKMEPQIPSGSGMSTRRTSRSRKSSTSSTSSQSHRDKSRKRRALKIKDKRIPKKKKTSEFRKLNLSRQLLQNRWDKPAPESPGVVTRSRKKLMDSPERAADKPAPESPGVVTRSRQKLMDSPKRAADKSEWTDETDDEGQN